MYKLLLCWRYLRTRYIALASIISVTLGVATMIVVNSVMAGFSHEMQDRIHGILSDVVFESRSLDGFRDPDWHMEQIRQVAGDDIEGMTPTVVVPAMLSFQCGGNWVTRQVQLIGIDEKTQSQVSDFGKYLQHPANREDMSFDLRDGGYDVRDHQAEARRAGARRTWPRPAGSIAAAWPDEQVASSERAAKQRPPDPLASGSTDAAAPNRLPSPATAEPTRSMRPADRSRPRSFDPAKEQHTGVVLGIAMASYRKADGEDAFPRACRATTCKLTFPTAGSRPRPSSDKFTIVDFYESKMSEYDSQLRLRAASSKLQQLRGMIDPTTGVGLRERHSDQAQAGRRRRRGSRQVARPLSARSSTAWKPGATSKGRCWPPCRWKPRSSTCCCS